MLLYIVVLSEEKTLFICDAGHPDVNGKYIEDGTMNKTFKFKKEGDSSMHIYQNHGFWYIGTLEQPMDVFYRCEHCPPNGMMPPLIGYEPDSSRVEAHPTAIIQFEPCLPKEDL